jgi:hypothetical protein
MTSVPLRILGAFSLVSLLMLVGHDASAARGPSTQEERDKALGLVQVLETDPLGDQAKDARRWLTVWLIEVPDISVKVCPALLAPLLGEKKNHAAEILTQMMFSVAAFTIKNPTAAADDVGTYTAGVEGSLRTYEAILRTTPKARWEALDKLLAMRDQGALKGHVAAAMSQCK